jgi:hypothetical protein
MPLGVRESAAYNGESCGAGKSLEDQDLTKWEYRSVAAGHNWDGLGEDGWELVGFDGNGRAHFKRLVPSGDDAGADQPGLFPHERDA